MGRGTKQTLLQRRRADGPRLHGRMLAATKHRRDASQGRRGTAPRACRNGCVSGTGERGREQPALPGDGASVLRPHSARLTCYMVTGPQVLKSRQRTTPGGVPAAALPPPATRSSTAGPPSAALGRNALGSGSTAARFALATRAGDLDATFLVILSPPTLQCQLYTPARIDHWGFRPLSLTLLGEEGLGHPAWCFSGM